MAKAALGDTIEIPKTLGGAPDGADLVGDNDEDIDDLELAGLDPDDDSDDDGYSSATDIAELRGQINTLTTMLQNRGTESTAAIADKAGMPKLDLSNLPDPVTKKDDFNRELTNRLTQYTETQSQTLQTQSQQQALSQRAAELETRFAGQYPALAKKKALMAAAVQEEAKDLQLKGRNIQAVMTSDPDRFLKRIAKRMQTELGITDDTSTEGRQQQRRAGRTAGVGAGSRGAQTPQGKKKDDAPMGFVAALKKQQTEMGLY